ncbi:MAG TPA: RNA polymerase sigma factor, RpoD/SigA family, partial [Synechococcales bacterium UBA10510]|nr:RNA polymerase sigma factor, RpoD/SigA family [Synechococcales bacterium UBA10510]
MHIGTRCRRAVAAPLSTTDLVRLYLQDIGRVDLLSQEEELLLARLVQQRERLLSGRDPAEPQEGHDPTEASPAWAEKVGLSLADLRRALYRGRRAKERMIQANLR